MSPSRLQILSYKLKHAANDGRLFVVTCSLCQRSEAYLASDLVEIWNPDRAAAELFGTCRHCGKSDYQHVRMRLPTNDDVGHLRIRRPDGVRMVQLWREDWYG